MAISRFIQSGIDTGESVRQKINGALHIFNVEVYGAKHDVVLDANNLIVSGTDDTVAIQNTIFDCWENGGGIVWFPKGIYRISGALKTAIDGQNPNCQIYIPSNSNSQTAKQIHFLGEQQPSFFTSVIAEYPVQNNGVILYSDITGSGVFPSVIGGKNQLMSFGKFFINANISFENIHVRTTQGSGMCGINMQNASNLFIHNVRVDTQVTPFNSVRPTAEIFGIRSGDTDLNSCNEFKNTLVVGYKYAYVFGELSNCDNVQAYGNVNAFCFTFANHASVCNKLVASGCLAAITTNMPNLNPGTHRVTIKSLMNEIGTYSGKWYASGITVSDAANYLYGDLLYGCVQGGVGFNNAIFSKTGGANLHCIELASSRYRLDGTNAIDCVINDQTDPSGVASPDFITLTRGGFTYSFQAFDGASTVEYKTYRIEIPHECDPTKGIELHFRGTPTTNATGDVRMVVEYGLQKKGANFVTGTSVESIKTIAANGNTNGTEYYFSFPLTTASTGLSTMAKGDALVVNIKREPANAADTYGDDFALVEFNAHVYVNATGEAI